MSLTGVVSNSNFYGGIEEFDGLMYGSLSLYGEIVNNLETVR